MQDIIMIILTLLAIVCALFAVLKKFNARFAFIAIGIIFLFIVTLIKGESILSEGNTGNIFLDIFDFIRQRHISTISGIGTTIMIGGGYVMFMNHIKASNVLANGAARLLSGIKSPYVVLVVCPQSLYQPVS